MKKSYLIFDRFLALVYDLIFLGLSLFGVILGFNYLNTKFFKLEGNLTYVVPLIICNLIYIIEFTILPLLIKGTIGKYLTELKVESTRGKITFGRLLFRELIFKHIFYFTVLGFIIEMCFYLLKKQTIHDFLLKTSVVRKEID